MLLNSPGPPGGTLLPPTRHEMDLFEGWAATLPGMEERPGYVYFLELRHRHAIVQTQELDVVRLGSAVG